MNPKSKILFIALLFGAYCCSPKGDGSVSIVNVGGNKVSVFSLNELKSDETTIPLSSLIEGCELVQLEFHEDALFNPQFTTVTEKYIGIRPRGGGSQSYKLFDRSGKFLGNVGSVGRGPGEYSMMPYDDIIDDKSGLIYFSPFSGDRIQVYNISGKFVKEIISPQWLAKAKIFLSGDILTVVHMAMNFPHPDHPAHDAAKAIAIQFDVNTGEVVKELAPPAHFIVQGYDGEIFNARNASMVFDFTHTSSDTLYHFDVKNNKIVPVFTMSYISSENPYKQYLQLNKNLYITQVFGKGYVATNLNSQTSSYIKVVNDYYGNMPTSLNVVTCRNGYYVVNITPEDMIERIEKRLAESSCTESDKQVLKGILPLLKEDDNNVMFIGKLKNDVAANLW